MSFINIISKKLLKKNNIIENSEHYEDFDEIKLKLTNYLKDLKVLEARLWGITINELSNGEERILEDVNHLIYKFQKSNSSNLKNYLKNKDVQDFFNDFKKLKEDFLILKKQIREKNKLKNYITLYTIKLVDENTYNKLEKIFILEKQLYEVIDIQNQGIEELTQDINRFKIVEKKDEKIDFFIDSLIKLRKILAGHIDYHNLWEDERLGYSNTSNILHSLLKIVSDINNK